jgi:cell division protein FtsB
MEKLNDFLSEHGTKVVIILLFTTFIKTCSIDRESTKIRKELKVLNQEVMQIKQSAAKLNDLKIMGLEAEKRMIQATDRKMLDVQRQNEIENEIKRLQNINEQ